MTALLQQFQAVSGLEALALLTGIGYAVLAVRHSRWCWVSGAVSSALLAWLASRQQLPMQVCGLRKISAGRNHAAQPLRDFNAAAEIDGHDAGRESVLCRKILQFLHAPQIDRGVLMPVLLRDPAPLRGRHAPDLAATAVPELIAL